MAGVQSDIYRGVIRGAVLCCEAPRDCDSSRRPRTPTTCCCLDQHARDWHGRAIHPPSALACPNSVISHAQLSPHRG